MGVRSFRSFRTYGFVLCLGLANGRDSSAGVAGVEQKNADILQTLIVVVVAGAIS